jgi:signal transduction histidine kinase
LECRVGSSSSAQATSLAVDTVYRHTPSVVLANLAGAAVFATGLGSHENESAVVLWLTGVCLLAAARSLLFVAYRKRGAASADRARWARRFAIGSMAAGALWGVSPLAFDAMNQPETELLCTFVIGGLVAGAAGSLACHLPSFVAFVGPALVPLAVMLALQGGTHGALMATMVVVYGIAMTAVARNVNAALIDALALRSENRELVHQREEHTRQLEEANRELDQRISERTAQLRAYGRRQRLAADLGCQALSKDDITAVGEGAAKAVREALHLDAVAIYELLPNEATLGLRGLDAPGRDGVLFFDVTNGLLAPIFAAPHPQSSLCVRAFDRASAVSSDEPSADVMLDDPMATSLGAKAFVCVPLFGDSGPLGIIFAAAHARREFGSGEVSFVEIIANIMAGAIGRRRNELVQRRSQQLEAMGRLATGVAHEINTPVQFIADSASFLERALHDISLLYQAHAAFVDALPPESRFADEAARLLQMRAEARIDYLLETAPLSLSRIRLGLARVAETVRATRGFGLGNTTPLVTDVNELLRGAAIITNHLTKRVADVKLDLGDMPRIVVHPGELLQVLEGFVSNAAYAIEERHGSVQRGTITLRSRLSGERVEIEVEDDGAGIPAERLPHVFEPFYTSKEAGRGSGQGLAIARDIIERGHGGRISVHSVVGRGTTFRIELPTAATHPTSWRSVVLSKKLTSLVPPPPAGRFARGA